MSGSWLTPLMAMRLLGFMVVLVDRGRWDGMVELALAMVKRRMKKKNSWELE